MKINPLMEPNEYQEELSEEAFKYLYILKSLSRRDSDGTSKSIWEVQDSFVVNARLLINTAIKLGQQRQVDQKIYQRLDNILKNEVAAVEHSNSDSELFNSMITTTNKLEAILQEILWD